MDSTLFDTPQQRWQIRVLNGAAVGTARVMDKRLSIGRAASADIHLVSTKISRQHAKIVRDDEGRCVLVDLSSSNGTFVGDQGVERHVLEPNTVFRVVDIELIFEEARESSGIHRQAPVVDGRTLRGTAQVERYEAERFEAERLEVQTRDYPTAEEVKAHERRASAAPGVVTDTAGYPLVFEMPDGREYDGNVLDDIIEYRSLRVQHLRGGFAEPGLRQHFDSLRLRLQQPPSRDPRIAQRAFCRFGCWVQAELRIADGETYPCHVRDLGVDGAQVVVEGHELAPETIAWLTIEVVDDGCSRAAVLAGRVVWVDEEFIGFAFAGAPPRVHGGYAERRSPRRREEVGTDVVTRPLRLWLASEPGRS